MSFTPQVRYVVNVTDHTAMGFNYDLGDQTVSHRDVRNGNIPLVYEIDSPTYELSLWIESGFGWIIQENQADREISVEWNPVILSMPQTTVFLAGLAAAVREERTELKEVTRSVLKEVKEVLLVNLRYPYGKPKIYHNGSLTAAATLFIDMGYRVKILDLNIDDEASPESQRFFQEADLVAVSLIGAPYIPHAIEFARRMKEAGKPVLFGGQVIESLTSDQFDRLFPDNTYQYREDEDLERLLGVARIPNVYGLSLIPAYQAYGERVLLEYVSREGALVVSNGCNKKCDFCAAKKRQREVLRPPQVFEKDLRFLVEFAQANDINELEFYASSLDFFQNPRILEPLLRVVARVQQDTGASIKIRCLSCMDSFLNAGKVIPDFGELLQQSGLWCVGFGVDGTDPKVWRAQKKYQNKVGDIVRCLDLAESIGVRPELLLVLGFPEDTVKTLYHTFETARLMTKRWNTAVARPYLYKQYVPGNDPWNSGDGGAEEFISDPTLLYDLDFCAIGSRTTHPDFWRRLLVNIAYLSIIGVLTPLGRCVTSPLLPQGGRMKWFARIVNRLMPFDR